METNKKIEQYNDSYEQFATIDLEYLNHEKEFTPEQEQNIIEEHERTKSENLEALQDVYRKQEDRENGNVFEMSRVEEISYRDNKNYFDQYEAVIENYGGREGYRLRPHMHLSQDTLQSQISEFKAEKRQTNRGKTFVKALQFWTY